MYAHVHRPANNCQKTKNKKPNQPTNQTKKNPTKTKSEQYQKWLVLLGINQNRNKHAEVQPTSPLFTQLSRKKMVPFLAHDPVSSDTCTQTAVCISCSGLMFCYQLDLEVHLNSWCGWCFSSLACVVVFLSFRGCSVTHNFLHLHCWWNRSDFFFSMMFSFCVFITVVFDSVCLQRGLISLPCYSRPEDAESILSAQMSAKEEDPVATFLYLLIPVFMRFDGIYSTGKDMERTVVIDNF